MHSKFCAVSRIILLSIIFHIVYIHAQSSVSFRWKFSFGQEGNDPGQFRQPLGLSTDLGGNIYIADTGNNRVQKFNAHGELLAINGGFGWELEQFQRPVDIYADKSLNVFIADYENRRIVLLDKDLHWITAFYSNPSFEEKLQFGFPNSVAVSIHDQLFIIDSENSRVLKFGLNRIPELSFGEYDWGEGVMANPAQVCISNDDLVYVTDLYTGIILIYDCYGNYLTSLGQGIFKNPTGLAFDMNKNMYVADMGRDQILCFGHHGELLFEMGSCGEKTGAFKNPNDLAVFQNMLYILDTDNHRVQVFEILFFDNE